MKPFRKHAPESTRRPNSLLASPSRAAYAATLVAALMALLLAAPLHAAASSQQKAEPKPQAGGASAEAPGAQPKEAPGAKEEPAAEVKIPMRIRRVNTPEGPGVVATIGDFPADLNQAGQEFLRREFFEHFASDVLGLGDSDSPRATLKIAMQPQEKENQREGDFTFGKVSGHMVVLVEKRRVLVACTFFEAEPTPQLMAGASRFAVRAPTGVIVAGQQKSDS